MKKQIIIIVITLFGYCNTAISQPTIFSRVLGSQSMDIQVNALTNSFDNGYILTGTNDQLNGMIIKVDSECNQVWSKEFYNSNTIHHPSIKLNSIIRTYDSCFFISGNAYNMDTENHDALCIKINSYCDTLWTTSIGGNGYKNILSSYQTYDSGYLLTGRTNIIGEVAGIFVAKLNLSGNVQWVRTIYMGNKFNTGYSIKQLPDSSYLVTGSMSNYPYESFPFLLNLSETGDINWIKIYITSNVGGEGYDFIVTDTGLLLLINMSTGVSFLYTDFTGNVLWNKSYKMYSEGFGYEISPKLYRTSDNSLLYVVGDRYSFGRMAKLDLEANALWFSELFIDPVNVTETATGEYLIYGNGPLYGVKNVDYVNPQIGFIQVDTMGNGTECNYNTNYESIVDTILSDTVSYTMTSDYAITNIPIEIVDHTLSLRDGCVDFIGTVDQEGATNELVIYPNPGVGIFNISLQNQETGRLTILNSFGQAIYQNNIDDGLKIDLSAQPRGVYYYLFGASDGKQLSGKLVITN